MAEHQELFDCSICLHLLKDPVTTACGHSYCMDCINRFWDQYERQKAGYSCPQCRQTFRPRPRLKRNTLLTDLLDKHKAASKDNTHPGAAGDRCASPGDVGCDACTDSKRPAVMFCLVCMAAYCETHLTPHFEVPPLKKHKLVQASEKVRESICRRHDKLLEIYCRTDQQCICLMCTVDQHRGHDTVPAAAERAERQRHLERTKQEVEHRALDSEREIEEVTQTADSMRAAAWETLDDFERVCMEHICSYVRSVERRCSEMRQKVGETEKAAVDRTNALLGKLRCEVSELRRREAQLNQLSLTEDPIQFLRSFQAVADLPASTTSPKSHEMLTQFVTAQKSKLEKMCKEEKNEIMSVLEKNMLSKTPMLQEKTTSRTYLLTKYKNLKLEVDPNTVAACLYLSDRNREISWSDRDQAHPNHPDRFTYYHQALCTDGLTGDRYWEVEWDGGIVEVAVAYKGISRKGSGNDCCFGHNDLSWSLVCSPSGCTFWHNNIHKAKIPPPLFPRVGVYLDYCAGILCFYSVSDSEFTRLHQVQTRFTEPLYPGFCVDLGATLKICKL
ncbi:E3 ubiquitin/ISG15 ligase TRIM25-like [Centroberyx affinis]|uniref:E3 ubiquitin/ISG15 ligase TRIM25-like n=1 Tax=Centroberyx affinis TaxID=166261 RepID=UPI003A5C3446